MELTVQNVYGLLLRSKLLALDEARAMYARWQAEAGDDAANLGRFAAWMVQHGYVTDYQAGLLARGHADGFFLGEYKVLDRLGKGRMAGVYRARHRLGQTVAIKVLPPSKAQDPMLLGRFQREAKLALQLNHPNIVRAFQVGVADGLHYLVMEHLEGETLDELLHRRKQLPVQDAVHAVYLALQGLHHIHSCGLVHRDLKPANLMLTPPPGDESTLPCAVKILDIGLGRTLADETAEAADPGLTGEGVILGTPDYMAPEQARDPRHTDIRADIYSLGCVLYHLIAGQPPFPDTNIITQMIRHATEPARPLREFNPAVPDGLQQIVNWMMAKEPSARYPTPERAARALEVFLVAGSTEVAAPAADVGMASYLRWLEREELKGAAAALHHLPTTPLLDLPERNARKSSAMVPTAETLVTSPGKRSSTPADSVPQAAVPPVPSGKSSRKVKKKHDNAAVSQKEAAGAVEVELIPVPGNVEAPAARFHLTRRDLAFFFLGVVGGLTAYAIGRTLAGWLSRPRPRDTDPVDDPTP